MKKGAIFDLDGTLVDTISMHRQAWQELFSRYDITLTPKELDEQSGMKNEACIAIIAQRRERADLDPTALAKEKESIVTDIIATSEVPVFPGVQEVLDGLREKGTPIALATSASKATAHAIAPQLIALFDTATFSEDVSHGKPDPEIFLKAAQSIGIDPKECIVFEDAWSGVEAAKAAGAYCVARDNGAGQDLSKADLVVTHYIPEEILAYFS